MPDQLREAPDPGAAVITDEAVEAAARGLFAEEQCDRRQREALNENWHGRLNEDDHAEYRKLARAALEAALPLLGPRPVPDRCEAVQKGATELSRAANRLDALTAEATEGPWILAEREDGHLIGIDTHDGEAEVIDAGPGQATDEDWRYIAAMNPDVGKALVPVLRRAAAHLGEYSEAGQRLLTAHDDERLQHYPLLMLARAINKGAGS